MAQQELRHHRPGLLKDLVDETDNLEIRENGKSVYATFRYKVPVNQFGIPQRDALIHMAITAAQGKLDWEGLDDYHHLAWPKSQYRSGSSDQADTILKRYRALPSLGYWGPRQMHEYLHVGFSYPWLPELDIAKQYTDEETAQRGLLSILRPNERERAEGIINEDAERNRRKRYHDRLDVMAPGEIGHLPDLGYLDTLEPAQARIEIGRRVRVLTFHEVIHDLAAERARHDTSHAWQSAAEPV